MYPYKYFTLDLDKLAKAQLARKMTNEDLCNATGLTRHTLNNLYQGRTRARLRTIIAFSKALDVDANELVKGGNVNE